MLYFDFPRGTRREVAWVSKVFVLLEKSVESLILTTTNPCHSAALKDLLCCDYISSVLNLGLTTSCSSEEVVLNHEICLELYICLS